MAEHEHATDAPSPGTITRLAPQSKNPERVSVYVDDAFAFGIHQDLLLEFNLRTGLHLDTETQVAIMVAERERAARAKALDYLSYKPRTAQEVRRKLTRSGFADGVAEQAVARMQDLGYVDDADYARRYAEQRFRSKGHGPRRIAYDLRRRGVARQHIDAALDTLRADKDLTSRARALARKRWKRLSREQDPYKRRRKLSRYLQRRGYSFDVIRRITDELEASD